MRRLVGLLLSSAALLPADPAWGVEILTPVAGTRVIPGTTITVKAGPSVGEQLTAVAFATSDERVVGVPTPSPANSFEAQIRIPPDAVGPEFIVAYAALTDGTVVATSVRLSAEPGPLAQLIVSAPPILTFIGQVEQLEVSGRFQDGITRDLTIPDRGTTYATSDASILGVTPTGLIQARLRGTAQIKVTSRGKNSIATVRVEVPSPLNNQIPVPDPGQDQVVQRETVVDLSGAASQDPDGDALRFEWTQERGRTVILNDPASSAPFFIAPRVTAPEVLEFALFVTDSRGARSFPRSVRITVLP